MKKPVASVLRVVGVGLVLLSIVLLALLWVARHTAPEPWWRWMFYCLPGITGAALLALGGKLAAKWTRDFEE